MWITADVDNTVANTNLELIRMFNISLRKYPSPEVPPEFFCGGDECLQMFQKVEPFPNAAETLQTMAQLGYKIAYLSSRPVAALFITVRWLQKHGFPADQVLCGLDPAGKVEVVTKELKAVAAFEDDPLLVAALLDKVPALWLKDWQYNRKLPKIKKCSARWNKDAIRCNADRVIRFKSWKEVQKAVVTSNPNLAALTFEEGGE